MPTPEHSRLIDRLESIGQPTWGESALLGCLTKLRSGGPTEGASVAVHDAWPFADGFCVVYTSPWGPTVGLRVVREQSGWGPICFSAVYADHQSPVIGEVPTAEEFGWEIADYAIGEPLGNRQDGLVSDSDGLGWWGDPPFPG